MPIIEAVPRTPLQTIAPLPYVGELISESACPLSPNSVPSALRPKLTDAPSGGSQPLPRILSPEPRHLAPPAPQLGVPADAAPRVPLQICPTKVPDPGGISSPRLSEMPGQVGGNGSDGAGKPLGSASPASRCTKSPASRTSANTPGNIRSPARRLSEASSGSELSLRERRGLDDLNVNTTLRRPSKDRSKAKAGREPSKDVIIKAPAKVVDAPPTAQPEARQDDSSGRQPKACCGFWRLSRRG